MERSFENNEPITARYINNPTDFDYLSDEEFFMDETNDYIDNYENYFTDQTSHYSIEDSPVTNNHSSSSQKFSLFNATDKKMFNQEDDDYCFIGTSEEEDITSPHTRVQCHISNGLKNQMKQVNTMQKILNST